MTLSEFHKIFQESMTLSVGTLKIYDHSFKNLIRVIGDTNLEELTGLHWERYKRKRLSEISPVTTNIELRTLRAALNRALDWKIIQSNPFSRQKQCLVPESAPTFFSVTDFEQLIKAIPDEWFKQLTIFGVLTGLRRSEITNLQWSDVDVSMNTLVVQSKADYKTKAGKKRIIAVTETAMQILMMIKPENVNQDEYVFNYRNKKIKPALLTKKLKKAVRDSRLRDQRLHFHSLRHTFASWLAQKGTSIYEIQKLLGHTDIKTTQIYAHLLPNQLHKTVSQLEGLIALQ